MDTRSLVLIFSGVAMIVGGTMMLTVNLVEGDSTLQLFLSIFIIIIGIGQIINTLIQKNKK
jgi:uncharacterized membrane protein HdeD (DUF308 family)